MGVEGVVVWFIERSIAAYRQIKCDFSEVYLMQKDLTVIPRPRSLIIWIMFFLAQSDWGPR